MLSQTVQVQAFRYDQEKQCWARHYELHMWLILTGSRKGELYVPRER